MAQGTHTAVPDFQLIERCFSMIRNHLPCQFFSVYFCVIADPSQRLCLYIYPSTILLAEQSV